MHLKTKTEMGGTTYMVSTVDNPFRPGGFETAVKDLTRGQWVDDSWISLTEEEARRDHDRFVIKYGGVPDGTS